MGPHQHLFGPEDAAYAPCKFRRKRGAPRAVVAQTILSGASLLTPTKDEHRTPCVVDDTL